MPKRLLVLISAGVFCAAGLPAQTRPAPTVDTAATVSGPRPIPGPVYEPAAFTRAVLRGTRARSGAPGPRYWVAHPRYRIEATLDPVKNRLDGRETVLYANRSPDTLTRLAVHLRQNVFAPGAPRRQPVPITGGVILQRLLLNGRALTKAPQGQEAIPGQYAVDGTVMWIALSTALRPGDSLRLDASWSYAPAPAPPSDGREGHEGRVYFMGYWYPQIAVYDDVDGWVADPYLLEAEFYMDPADYDVRITVPHNWIVGATGTLANREAIFSRPTLDSLGSARASGRVIRILTPGSPAAARAFVSGTTPLTWHWVANNVRDFAWGTSDQYAWDVTRALVRHGAATDTVDINSYFRLSEPAAAWRIGGARYTRDAVQEMSQYLWPYPYPAMSSFEGVLDGGGMEYPMATVMQPWADTLSLAGDLMHETGHMWFPMQVGSNETRFPWMDEGFTQFDVAQCMRALYGEPRGGTGRPNDAEPGQRATYVHAARAGQDLPLILPGTGDDYPQALYYIMYYNKTAQVLAALRGLLGEATFHRAFVEYGRRWIDRHPEPYDFFNTIADVSGRDLSWFWTTWFYHGWPLDQAVQSVAADGDSATITIVDRGLAPMPILLAVTRADKSVQRVELPVEVWFTGNGVRKIQVRVTRDPQVAQVEIDPDGLFPDIDRANNDWTR